MVGSNEADDFIFDNKPIIIKDKYTVSGSDMAQIGWIEVTGEDGVSGYLWYLKSEHDTRLRFEDYLETAMVEAVPADAGSGAADFLQGVGVGAGAANLQDLMEFSIVYQQEEMFSEVETQCISSV